MNGWLNVRRVCLFPACYYEGRGWNPSTESIRDVTIVSESTSPGLSSSTLDRWGQNHQRVHPSYRSKYRCFSLTWKSQGSCTFCGKQFREKINYIPRCSRFLIFFFRNRGSTAFFNDNPLLYRSPLQRWRFSIYILQKSDEIVSSSQLLRFSLVSREVEWLRRIAKFWSD